MLYTCAITTFCFAQSDPLPSWNEGPTKQAILQFIKETTLPESEDYLAPEERIATFDQDGTLWVEQPLYTQFVFAIEMAKSSFLDHPERKIQDFYHAIKEGDFAKIKDLTSQEIEKILAATHTGMTVDEFKERVQQWLEKAVHPRYQRPYPELIYQPMLEVIQLLKNHDFKIYIVSGGGQEFMRAYAEKVYGVPPEQIIGSTGKVKYEYRNGQPVLVKIPQMLFIDDKEGKPEAINLFIGRVPVAAFGNSDGDQQMLEWSAASQGKSLQLLIHHDDPVREYAYDTKSKIGTFPQSLMDEAKKRKWIIVSMKNDWTIIFPWEKSKE